MVVINITQPNNPGLQSNTRLMARNLDRPGNGCAFLISCLLLVGCAEQPVLQLDAAIQAIEDARMSGAEDYAIEIFTEAESAYGQAKEELNQQQERLQLFRDYHPATTMLAKVLSNAEQAKMEAIDNKKEAKANAEVALAFARQNLQTVRSLLADSSIPVTDQGQFDQITQAFQATETLLAETESIMTEENFIGVMTTAHTVESFATRIQEHILSARQLATKRQV
jgi:hypothetical protein